MIEPQDRLDKALDDALASYVEATPHKALEERILARVAANKRRAHPSWPLLLFTATALSIIAIGLAWWNSRASHTRVTPPFTSPPLSARSSEPPPLPPAPEPARTVLPANTARTQKVRKRPTAPKLLQFPTPSPVTAEERALLHLVRSGVSYIPAELTNFGGPVRPIEITALEVKPLQTEWRTQEKTCCDQ